MASRSDAGADADAPSESVAAALASAGFVRIVPCADGDALAAGGLLARALRDVGVAFQVRVAPFGADVSPVEDGLAVAVGAAPSGADVTLAAAGAPSSLRAYEIAEALAARHGGAAPDPVLALAGVVAAGAHPGSAAGSLLEVAEAAGSIERRPGVAIPVDDVVDGLAHSTLVRAPFSGDTDAAAAELAGLTGTDSDERDADGRRSIASHLALGVAADEEATPRAATAVERALRPYATPQAPFETLGGFADVLNATARERPGTGVAVALGHGGHGAAVDAWRTHGRAVHRAVRSAHTGRYDGVFVVRPNVRDADASGRANDPVVPGRLATVARLVRDFRSPEPVVLALEDGVAALAAVDGGADDAARALASEFVAGDSTTATWTAGPTAALARFDAETADADVIAAVREALQDSTDDSGREVPE
ncbi:hypothetical protein [Halobellus ordinarius]|uniref:hypothetical protein n=1 Tax=Halobellus ordinarius TaxID=3075120 RepID=UPI002880521D|nr:hypothetical protein [Halobellus sp. ZY16]